MPIKLSKVEHNSITENDAYAPSIKMGIDKAPSSLIVKYITHMYESPLDAAIRETVSNAFDSLPHPLSESDRDDGVRVMIYDDDTGFFGDFSSTVRETQQSSLRRPPGFREEKLHKYPKYHSFIVVRDSGKGMDYDTLVDVYTQYGISDKREDMESIGAFGLGAKSPLAYASEFHVFTKKADGDCLYVTAYRTANEEFLANLPIVIPQDGSQTISITREFKGRELHIVPPATLAAESKNTNEQQNGDDNDSGSDADERELQTVTANVTSPFSEGESGTIVIFPLETANSVGRAESIIDGMDSLMARTNTGRVTDSPKNFSPYVELLPLVLDSEDGEPVEFRIYMPNEYAISKVAASAFAGYDPKDENKQNMTIAFKVCNWLYPLDEKWVPSYRAGRYDMNILSDIVVDAPSGALPFIPSRDAIKKDDAVMRPLIDSIYKHINECIKDPHAGALMSNGFAETSYRGYDAASGVDALLSYQADSTYDEKNEVVTYTNVLSNNKFKYVCAISLDELELAPGYPATSLYDSPVCMVGLCKSNEQGFTNKGVIACGSSKLERLLSTAYRRGGKGAGYSIAKSKTVADEITAYNNPATNKMQTDNILLASVPDQDAKNLTGSFFDCAFPVASALPHVLSKHCSGSKTALVVVDGSHAKKLASIRTNILNILSNNNISSDTYDNVIYVVIPKKTPDDSDKWSQSEITELYDKLKDIAVATQIVDADGVKFQKAVTLAKNMKKQETKEALRKEETDELAKMFRLGSITHLVKPHSNDRNDAFKTFFPKNRMDGVRKQLFESMMSSPSNWGIVVMEEQDDAAALAATAYGQALIAMDMVASDAYILGLSSRNFNKKRADIAKRQGIPIIYDETNKGELGSKIPAGGMTYESNGVHVHGPIPKEIALVKANKKYESWQESTIKEINTAFLNSESYESHFSRTWLKSKNVNEHHHDANELLDIMSFGALQYDIPADRVNTSGWKNETLCTITWDNELTEEEKRKSAQFDKYVQGTIAIWKSYFALVATSVDLKKLERENLPLLSNIGKALGIDLAVSTLYDGVPIEDICA